MTQLNQPGTGPQKSGGGFWTTLPGVLTGAAALVASIGGLVGVLFAAGVIGGDGPGNTPVAGLPTATPQFVVATPTTQILIATPTTGNGVPIVVTATPFVAEAAQEIQIDGFWVSQGGFSWQITQIGTDVEIASLDILGTTYIGIRTGDFIRINLISDGFSVTPASGSMQLQAGGDVMQVEIGGVPDVMVRQ